MAKFKSFMNIVLFYLFCFSFLETSNRWKHEKIFLISVCVCSVAQWYPTPCDHMDYSPPVSLFMDFSKQGYWSGLTLTTQGDLPYQEIEPTSLASPALAGLHYLGSLFLFLLLPLYISFTKIQFTHGKLGQLFTMTLLIPFYIFAYTCILIYLHFT